MAKRKLFSLVLVCIFTFIFSVNAVGCGLGQRGGEEIDTNKTQLYIGIYGGGFGTKYMDDLEERFEKYAENMVFEDGRKGVQIIYQEDKDKYQAFTFVDNIMYDTNELYYLSGSGLDDFLMNDSILDITDIVTEPLTKFGETKSIADKINPALQGYLNRGGKYYQLPFIESSTGMIYDMDVFEENDLYLAKNGAPSEALQAGGSFNGYIWVGAAEDGARSAGPDGNYATEYDNGLPATLEEFEMLITRMGQRGVDSVIWTGQYADAYTPFLPKAFQVNHHGKDEANILMDGGGENGRQTEIITGFDSNGQPNVEKVTVGVSLDNVELVAKQEGYYYGLKMFEIMLNSETVSNYSFEQLSHVETQEKFLVSNHRFGERPIAFMIDGAWWESEADASGTFADNLSEFGLGKLDRRFGFFPMPNATDSDYQARINGKKGTIIGGSSSVVVNKNVAEEKKALIKEFIQFSLTDESLRRFTINTSLPAPYIYNMEASDQSSMTKFTQNYFELYKNSEIYYELPSKVAVTNETMMEVSESLINMFAYKELGGARYGLFPIEVEYNGVTAEDYFKGLYHAVSAT